MTLKQRLQFQRELIRIEIFLKDYEERDIKIRENEYPIWLKNFIKKCKKIGIPDQVAEEGTLKRRDYKEYIEAMEELVRWKR